jgi:hypothetical protein
MDQSFPIERIRDILFDDQKFFARGVSAGASEA